MNILSQDLKHVSPPQAPVPPLVAHPVHSPCRASAENSHTLKISGGFLLQSSKVDRVCVSLLPDANSLNLNVCEMKRLIDFRKNN